MSTRNKLVLLVIFSLLLLAAGTGLVTMRSVENTMLREQRQNATTNASLAVRNVLHMYDLSFHNRVVQVKSLQQYIRTISETLEALAEGTQAPQAMLNHYPLPKDITLFALHPNGKIALSRGDNRKENPYPLHDIKGRPVMETMLRQAQKGLPAVALVRIDEGGSPKRLYGRHFYLDEINLLVGIWTDISSLDEQQKLLASEGLEELQDSFQAVKLGPSGFLFVVNAQGRRIVGPDTLRQDLATPLASGVVPLQYIQEAARSPEKSITAPATTFLTGDDPREALLRAHFVKELGWYVGGIVYPDEARAPGRQLSLTLVIGVVLTMLGILPLAIWFATKATLPLRVLAYYARQLPEQDFMLETAPPKEVTSLAKEGSDPEVSELARSFLFMDSTLRSRVRALMDVTIARERMQGELATAVEIQTGFLPSPLPAEVCANRFTLAASLVPAREVGGDLYDFFMLDDNRLCFAIGDVSDKGVPAALFMSVTMTLLRANPSHYPTPESLMCALNDYISKDNAKCMFVTLFIGVLNLTSGELLYVNAGHNPPVRLGADGSVTWLEGLSGPVVGAMEGMDYSLLRTTLVPGDALFLYTDGLNEAMNVHNEQYGNDRMLATLARIHTETPEAIIDYLRRSVDGHILDHPPSDDLTMFCLRYQGPDRHKETV